jgi:GNAT superfamily N-acetyltransferase
MANSADIRIVNATPEHIKILHGMIEALADHLKLGHELISSEADLQQALFGAHPQAEVVLAYMGEQAAGFLLFYNNYSTFRGRCGLHLEDLFVRPEWRGHGIGKCLLTHVARLTLQRGCGRMEWWVLSEDANAIEFYENLGAIPKEEWTIFRLRGEALESLAKE